MKTAIQKLFAPFKSVLPRFVWTRIRAIMTALITPVIFSMWSGHFKSSLKEKAVSRTGKPLPWYTYPCIHLLLQRDFCEKRVLEFGAGQSTLWWADRAAEVVSCEGDKYWHSELSKIIPNNVELRLISTNSRESFFAGVNDVINSEPNKKYDIIVIDGDFREELVLFALNVLAPSGALICDDAESYRFHEVTRDLPIERVDFFGHSPGVVLPHCTSIYFKDSCFLFDPRYEIPDLAKVI